MKILNAALIPLLVLTACESPRTKARSSGSVAASTDDALVYAADTDNGILAVMDVKTETIVRTIKVGEAPWRVVVAADDTVFVANRGSRSISVIRRGEATVAAELATDVDPVGLALDDDGILYVVCAAATDAAEYGTLTAFDTKNLTQQWSISVGEEPRGIAIIAGKRALVSLYHEGEVVEVDLAAHALVKAQRSSIHQSVSTVAINTGSTGLGGSAVAFHPRGTGEVIAIPDGTRAFVVGSLSREAPIVTPPSTTTPYYKQQGPGLAGSVTTSAVFTFDTAGAVTPKIDDVSSTNGYSYSYGSSNRPDPGYPQTSFATPYAYQMLQGPTVGVSDYSGEWLYVVNRESGRVGLISAKARAANPEEQQNSPYGYGYYSGPTMPSLKGSASIGQGADGIVILGDNKKIYVYNQFDHAITPIVWKDGDIEGGTQIPVSKDVLTPNQVAGRKLFFDANDRRISAVEASVACSSCHLEGRDDGHTWSFPDGPRQTPTLAGRGTLHTAPFHWSGEFETIDAFLTHTLTARMGGTGLDAAAASALNAYVDKLPTPENPYLKGELTAEQVRGKAVFAKAQCGTCHGGEWLTNNSNMNVATLSGRDNGLVVKGGINVPSLRGLARSGPYLHDGSVVTLSERVTKNPGDQHGITSTLTPDEVTDLVAYLRAL